MECNETQGKWCKNKHGSSKIIDTFETYQAPFTGELSLIRSLRDQHELKRVTAKVEVALSKASLAADVERFLLGEIDNLGKAMKCKCFPSLMCSSSDRLLLFPSLLNTDACLDAEAEARRVNAHLHATQTHANLIADHFWADRSKAEKLTMLQDQISQARALAETCHAALAIVH
jgi:hypothetical protein